MKRVSGSNELAAEESRYSRLLFNNPEDFLKKTKFDVKSEDGDKKDAVWQDEDDEAYSTDQILKNKDKRSYTNELQQKYKNLIGTPSWAKIDKKIKTESSDEDDDKDAVLRTVGHLSTRKSVIFKSGIIELKRFPLINKNGDEGPIVKVLQFHPSTSVAMVAGNTVFSIYTVGGDENNKLHSVSLSNFRINASSFTPDGNQAFLTAANSSKYYIYDLIKAGTSLHQFPKPMKPPKVLDMSKCGKYIGVSDGFNDIYILTTQTKELLHKFTQNSNVQSITFNHDSTKLYSFGDDGTVIIFDLNVRKISHKFVDNGCIQGSVLSESPCGVYLATGSCEGIVNVYTTTNLNILEPVPTKTITNLTTKITTLKFNSTSEILGLSSSYMPNSMKLYHVQSESIFSNFPEAASKFNQVQTFDFSPHSGFLGIANNKHKAYLYRLKHYLNY